jgi:hypothetical protein
MTWMPPPPLSPETPRRVEANPKAGIYGFSLVYGVLFVFLITDLDHFRTIRSLQESGLQVTGHVVGKYMTKPGRHPPYHVVYEYVPRTSSNGAQGVLTAENAVSGEDYQRLRIGQGVPVVYDTTDPKSVALNFKGEVYQEDPLDIAKGDMAFMAIYAPIYLVALIFLLRAYFREKRLLRFGIAAPAEITEEIESGMNENSRSRLIYRFEDGSGNWVEGIKNAVPGKYDGRPASVSYRMCLLDNPTVLYDPRDSARNLLYPSRRFTVSR